MRNTLRMLIGAKLRYLAPLPVPRRIRRHSGPSSWLGSNAPITLTITLDRPRNVTKFIGNS